MKTLLAVISDWQYAQKVLEYALSLAKEAGGKVRVFRPVHDQFEELNRYIGFDNFPEMRNQIMEEERKQLQNLLGGRNLEHHTEWSRRPSDAIKKEAAACGADLVIIAASYHSRLAELVRTPDDWQLLRETDRPVMILSHEEHKVGRVAVALDCMEESEEHRALSGRVLERGAELAAAYKVPLEVITVVPDPTLIYADMLSAPVVVDYRADAEQAAVFKQKQMLESFGVKANKNTVVTGRIELVLEEAAAEAGLLVIGNAANKGLKGFFLGNTAERVLHHVSGDVVVVP